MTKEEFLRDPVNLFWGSGQSIPKEWLRDAWNIDQFRENATYEMIRSVRKDGDFFHVQYWLSVLPEFLFEEEVIQLYVAIRDQSHRYEDEWREEFEAAFPNVACKLPPPRVEDQSEITNP